jgi:hypothetical protein
VRRRYSRSVNDERERESETAEMPTAPAIAARGRAHLQTEGWIVILPDVESPVVRGECEPRGSERAMNDRSRLVGHSINPSNELKMVTFVCESPVCSRG